MAALFGWTSLNTGEILRKELVKTSDAGKIVAESFEKHEYGKQMKLLKFNNCYFSSG